LADFKADSMSPESAGFDFDCASAGFEIAGETAINAMNSKQAVLAVLRIQSQ
jgi:hypothetical protein